MADNNELYLRDMTRIVTDAETLSIYSSKVLRFDAPKIVFPPGTTLTEDTLDVEDLQVVTLSASITEVAHTLTASFTQGSRSTWNELQASTASVTDLWAHTLTALELDLARVEIDTLSAQQLNARSISASVTTASEARAGFVTADAGTFSDLWGTYIAGAGCSIGEYASLSTVSASFSVVQQATCGTLEVGTARGGVASFSTVYASTFAPTNLTVDTAIIDTVTGQSLSMARVDVPVQLTGQNAAFNVLSAESGLLVELACATVSGSVSSFTEFRGQSLNVAGPSSMQSLTAAHASASVVSCTDLYAGTIHGGAGPSSISVVRIATVNNAFGFSKPTLTEN